MLSHVPGKDPRLVEVEWHAIFGFVQQNQVLRDLLVSVRHLIQLEARDDSLPLRVLGDFERNIEIKHAAEHPSYVRF